jgi:hypothetical protein
VFRFGVQYMATVSWTTRGKEVATGCAWQTAATAAASSGLASEQHQAVHEAGYTHFI